MVKPSLAQHRLGGPPTEVPIPFDPPHSSATCFGTLFFKPVFKPIPKSQALCECFWHTGNWSNSSTIMHLNVEEQKQNFIQLQFFKFLGCQIKTGYTCAMIGSGFRLEGTCSHTLGYMKIIILSFALSFFCHLLLSFFLSCHLSLSFFRHFFLFFVLVLSLVPVIFLSFFYHFPIIFYNFWWFSLIVRFFSNFLAWNQ